MCIYVNESYEIVSIDEKPNYYFQMFEVEQSKSEMFGNLCDTCIKGYKYEPHFEFLFNEDGSNVRDEKTGELLYKLDDKGNKIPAGYACYSFVDYKMLMLIQKQYEESQKQIQTLNAQIEYISLMSGIEAEVSHE